MTRGGTIYFTREDPADRSSAIYRSRLVDGRYVEAERLGSGVNAFSSQFNAFIAPDESYLIVCSTGHDGARAKYFVTFRNEADEWSGVKVAVRVYCRSRIPHLRMKLPDQMEVSANLMAMSSGKSEANCRERPPQWLHPDSPWPTSIRAVFEDR